LSRKVLAKLKERLQNKQKLITQLFLFATYWTFMLLMLVYIEQSHIALKDKLKLLWLGLAITQWTTLLLAGDSK